VLDAELNYASNGPSFKGIALEKYPAMDQNTDFSLDLLVCLVEICSSTGVHRLIGFV
jgi:hypothetical protein